jgi:hypothetical protein
VEEKGPRTGRFSLAPAGRVILDSEAGVVRSWFDPLAKPAAGPISPRELARDLLRQSARELRWDPSLPDLEDRALVTVAGSDSVRFTQRFKGLRVWASEVIVNMHADGRVHSLYNQYHYDIPAGLEPARARMSILGARAVVARLARAYRQRRIGRPTLTVYRYQPFKRPLPKPPRRGNKRRARFLAAVAKVLRRGRAAKYHPTPGQHYLVWDVTLATTRPFGRWRILVDAVAGRLLEVQDMLSYARGPHGKVFDPNPVVTSGDLTLSSATPAVTLNAQRVPRNLERLDQPDESGFFLLTGGWVHMEDIDEPVHAGPRKKNGSFVFGSKNQDFLDVMAYYHVDRFQQYLKHDLGLDGVGDCSIPVDPQGAGGADNSFGSAGGLSLGASFDGSGVADASDAMVILHEYGHALQDFVIAGSNQNNFVSGVAEGFCDFLPAVYYDDKHVKPSDTRGLMFSWNDNRADRPSGRRRYNWPAPPDSTVWDAGGGYDKGQQWASAMFELYRKLGGDSAQAPVSQAARDLVIRLHLVANGMIPGVHATITQMAQQIEAADTNLAGWRYANDLHLKVIYDTFVRRHVKEYDPLPVDVYIDDGRGGGYGSVKPNPTFDDSLWLENHSHPPGLWVQAPGAAAGPPGAASVKVGVAAQVFARIANLGDTNSGPVTVKAFVAQPGTARVWPVDWQILDPAAPSTPVGDVAKKPDPGVVIPPFTWTPTKKGAHTLLVIVECPKDQAVTELLLAADRVPLMDLVPFDNNIAMRDIRVTA